MLLTLCTFWVTSLTEKKKELALKQYQSLEETNRLLKVQVSMSNMEQIYTNNKLHMLDMLSHLADV